MFAFEFLHEEFLHFLLINFEGASWGKSSFPPHPVHTSKLHDGISLEHLPYQAINSNLQRGQNATGSNGALERPGWVID